MMVFDELELNELEDKDEDESVITCELEVHIDGQKNASSYERHFGIEHAKEMRRDQLGKPGKCYYVKMMEENGLRLTQRNQ